MTPMIPIVLMLTLTGCQEQTATQPADTTALVAPEAAHRAQARSSAPFPLWKQGFEQGTDSWITDDTPGAEGWCGDIERVSSDGMKSSAGRAHAVVRQGACNEYWQANGFAESGPYSAGAGYSEAWPSGGYVTELDIYLDPGWSAGDVFTLAISINLLDREFPTGFRYFMVPVTRTDGGLQVGDHTVTEPGWYTFRFIAGNDAGQLALSFELSRHGRVQVSMPVGASAFTGEAAGSFAASNVGSGYLWFASIADGLDLHIDEQQVRRGR